MMPKLPLGHEAMRQRQKDNCWVAIKALVFGIAVVLAVIIWVEVVAWTDGGERLLTPFPVCSTDSQCEGVEP